MTVHAYYWIAFLTYSVIVISMGVWVWLRDKKKGTSDSTQAFWAAERRLSGWSVGLSISASMMSISWSCVYGVQLFYWYGIGAVWLLIIPWLITMAGFFVLAGRFRALDAFSQPEFLARRFGKRSRQVLAPALIFVFIVWAGAEIYAAGLIISPFLGIPLFWTLFLITVVVASYSFTGGFEAVVSTDKIQFALVALFVLVMAVIGLNAAGPEMDWLAATKSAPKSAGGTPWFFSPGIALILLTFFAYLPGWLIETDIWIRLQAGRNTKEARKGIALAAFNAVVFVGLLPLCIGLAALYLYPAEGTAIPERLQDGAVIFTVLMEDFSPSWLNVLLGIGLVAAAMSTVDTCGNVVALSLSYDLIEPRLEARWTPARLNALARWVSVGAIFLAFFYALFTESLWDIFYLSSGILTTTVFLPVLLVFTKSATSRQAILAAASGFFGTLAFYFLESRNLLAFEPEAIAETGLGYILWGFLCSVAGFGTGRFFEKQK